MYNALIKRAVNTFKKFDEGMMNSEGSPEMDKPSLKHIKMMITADDETSFIFDLEYDEKGDTKGAFTVLQKDAEGNVKQVPLEKLKKDKTADDETMEVPQGILLN
jgi:hypothetical protein